MSNFKSGSGNLDFGASDKKDETDEDTTETTTQDEETEANGSVSTDQSTTSSPDKPSSAINSPSDQPNPNQESAGESTTASSTGSKYPYFVRRSNVGDERETRLEIHVRDKVADREAKFRSELAEQLGSNEVSKTDAREFALLVAYEHPERVAELMREEGFGTLG